MIYPIDYGVIPTPKLELNRNEVMARLQMARSSELEFGGELISALEQSILCKYSAVRTEVRFYGSGRVDLGFGELESQGLAKSLNGCREAFVFAVTLGVGVDRLLGRLSLTSPAEHFIADAFASAYAESAADKVQETVGNGLKLKPRFSPGYGDLDLSCQENVLSFVNAQRLLGISLNKSLLMSPTKSITAIVGIKNE